MGGEGTHKTDKEHGEPLHGTAPHQTPPAPERVGKEKHEDEAGDHLDDAVDALCEEGGCRAAEAEALEDGRGVVVYRARLFITSALTSHRMASSIISRDQNE